MPIRPEYAPLREVDSQGRATGSASAGQVSPEPASPQTQQLHRGSTSRLASAAPSSGISRHAPKKHDASASAVARWARAGHKVRSSLAVAQALAGDRFESLASEVAMARQQKLDAAAVAAEAAGPDRAALRSGRTVNTDHGVTFGNSLFISAGPGGEVSLALVTGAGNKGRMSLYNMETREKRIAFADEGLYVFVRLSPDQRRVCCSIGIDSQARLTVRKTDAGTPWPELWSATPGDVTEDAHFSADSSVIASVRKGSDQVDFRDAEMGTLLRSVPFGVCPDTVPASNVCFSVRFSDDLLVVSGGFQTTDEQTVGIWRLDKISTGPDGNPISLAQTNIVTDAPTQRLRYTCAVGPIAVCSEFVGVGSIDGAVNLHKIESAPDKGKHIAQRCIRLADPREAEAAAGAKVDVRAVTFSHDGSMLAAAWATGEVLVFDTGSTARVAKFFQDDTCGVWDMTALCFSLDDAKLAMGGGTCATISIHQISTLRPKRFSIEGNERNLTSAAVSEQHIALVADTRVIVQLHSGEEVAYIDTGLPITSFTHISPVALRSSGEHVAVVLSGKIMVVYSFEVPDGKEVFRKGHKEDLGLLGSVRYSPDGSQLLAVALLGGCYVFDSASGDQLHHLHAGTIMIDATVDPNTKHIIHTAWGGADGVGMWDSSSGLRVEDFDDQELAASYRFNWPCVDKKSERLAYMRVDMAGNAATVVQRLGETQQCLGTFAADKMVGPRGFHGDLLLQAVYAMEETESSDVSLVNLHTDCAANDTCTNEWLPLVLGTGHTAHSSVGWVPTDGGEPTIHATVGSELVFVDLQQFETLFLDGCVGADLLMDLCGDGSSDKIYLPEMIRRIIERFPHCVNVPKRSVGTDIKIGDTVLHYCARKHRTNAVEQLLPLGIGIYTPISSGPHGLLLHGEHCEFDHWTALHEAIARNNKDMVLHLMATLNTSMNVVTAALVTDAVKLMSSTMQHLMPQALQLLDTRLLRTEATIETRIHAQDEAFVSGRESLDRGKDPSLTESAKQGALQNRASVQRMPSQDWTSDTNRVANGGMTWGEDYFGTEIFPSKHPRSRVAQVDIKVLQVADWIGRPGQSPFAAIVENCDFEVCNSKIMKAAIDFKWQRVKYLVYLEVTVFAASLMVASITMVTVAWATSSSGSESSSASDAMGTGLCLLMLAMEALLLVQELSQLYVRRSKWLSMWNIMDSISILLLIMAGALLLADQELREDSKYTGWQLVSTPLRETTGSIGLALKWIGLLGHLDSFTYFSRTIKMILVISTDIVPYITVYFICILALVFFLIVDMPSNPAFADSSTVIGGLLSTLFGAWQTGVMGSFEISEYSTRMARLVFVLFTLVGNLIMLNLLIAVMGNSFERIKADEQAAAMMEQAETIVEHEEWCLGLGLVKPTDVKLFPKFMIIAEEVVLNKSLVDGVKGSTEKHPTAPKDDIDNFEVMTQVEALKKEMKEMKQQNAEDRAMAAQQHEETKQMLLTVLAGRAGADPPA